MATYKGIAFSDRVAPLARHMPALNDHREALASLSGTWDTLALLAHLSNLKADMRGVRASFARLTDELLVGLAEESLALAEGALGRQAQAAMDLLARELSQRGAEAGALATDPAGPPADFAAIEREAAAIFERIATHDEVLAFVDGEDRIVVSNDAARLPPGHRLVLRDGAAAMRLGGVTHLVARRDGRRSQDDPGLVCRAVALAPVELAFGADSEDAAPVDFSGETVFSQRLLDLPARARDIQRRLDRMVWNGRLHQAAESNAFSRSLLEEIAATGRKTKEQFERASSELLATVAASLRAQTRFLARLSVDLLESQPPREGAPGLDALLRAALPEAADAVAAFCRPDGGVIDRTAELPVTLPASVLSLGPGQSWSGLLAESGHCFIVGASIGRGRDDPVIGVVVIPCGQAVDRHVAAAPQIASVAGGSEIATFLIGEHLLGVPAGDVIECVEVTAAVRVWRGGFAQRHVGFVTWNDMALPLVDIAADLNAAGAAQRHALVLQAGAQRFGLLVSELGPVAEMRLTEERGLTGRGDASRLIAQLARSGPVFIPVLSPDAIFGGPAG